MTRTERLMEALRRDMATLAGPPEYVSERTLYEERIAGYRRELVRIEQDKEQKCER